MFETSKHSIRSGRLSRFSASRSSSRAWTRRRRSCSRCAASVSTSSRAFSTASSTSRRFSPRAGARTTTRDPRRAERNSAIAPVSAALRRDEHLGRDARRRAVVLDHERLQHRELVLLHDVLEMEPVAVDHLPVSQREDLDGCPVARDREPDDVDRADGPLVGRLPLGEVADREEPIPIAGGVLETLFRRGLPHPLLQLALDRRGVAGEELDDAVDDLAVGLRRDRLDAGREAAVDVEVEARDARVAARARPLARPELEHAVEHVQRLAHLLRVRVRAEVDRAAPVPLPREHDPRVLVRDRHRDVRERLVVAEPDIERRAMALDEVLLEMERLGLVAGDDDLDVRDHRGELGRSRPAVRALEVAAHARAQRLRLPDVEHVAVFVPEEVDPRGARERLQLLFKVFSHSAASVSP